jgi:hypothetical protein
VVDTEPQITLGRVSDSGVAAQIVRYRERLWVPLWWWPLSLALPSVVALEINHAVPALPEWIPFAVLFPVAAAALLWLGRVDVRVAEGGGEVEFWAGEAHLPVTVIARSAVVPRSAKSATLGRQLDPAAFVVHRGWVGPMVLLVVEDADDPTPYWLVSCRHPDRVLSALRS